MFENTKSFNKLVGFSALSIAGSAAFFFGLWIIKVICRCTISRNYNGRFVRVW